MTAAGQDSQPSSGLVSRRELEGIEVVEIRAGYSDYVSGTAKGYLARIISFFKFAFASSWAVTRLARPDVIFATSPPLTIGIPALVASKYHKAPMVFEVRDLWPEAPVQLGALRNPLVIRLARWLERTTIATRLTSNALSPGMKEGVRAAGVAPKPSR